MTKKENKKNNKHLEYYKAELVRIFDSQNIKKLCTVSFFDFTSLFLIKWGNDHRIAAAQWGLNGSIIKKNSYSGNAVHKCEGRNISVVNICFVVAILTFQYKTHLTLDLCYDPAVCEEKLRNKRLSLVLYRGHCTKYNQMTICIVIVEIGSCRIRGKLFCFKNLSPLKYF